LDPRSIKLRWQIGAAVIASLLFFYPAVQLRGFIFGADAVDHLYPWRDFCETWLRQGVLPLWNPYVFTGVPALQGRIWYPPNWIGIGAGTSSGINLLLILHVAVTAIGGILLGRQLGFAPGAQFITGIALAFNHSVAANTYGGHVPRLSVITWIPWLWLGLSSVRRRGRRAGVLLICTATALMFTAGHPQFAYYAIAGSGVWLLADILAQLRRTGIRRAVLDIVTYSSAVLLGLALASVDLLPMLNFSPQSSRAGRIPFEFASDGSFPVENMISAVIPGIMGNGITHVYWGKQYYWEVALYPGVLLLLLLAAAPWRSRWLWPYAALAAAALALAVGPVTPLFSLAYTWLPGMATFRVPARLLTLVLFSLAVAGGAGFDQLLRAEPHRLRGLGRRLIVCGAGLVVVLIGSWMVLAGIGGVDELRRAFLAWELRSGGHVIWLPAEPVPEFLAGVAATASRACARSSIAVVSSAVVLWLMCRYPKTFARLLPALILYADLWIGARPFIQLAEPTKFYWSADSAELLRDFLRDGRLLSLTNQRALNQGIRYGIANIGGYDSTNLKTYTKIYAKMTNQDSSFVPTVVQPQGLPPGSLRLGVTGVLAAANVSFSKQLAELAAELPEGNLYRVRGAPRVQFARSIEWASEDQILERYLVPFAETEPVFVSDTCAMAGAETPDVAGVTVNSITPNRISVSLAGLQSHSALVLRDAWYPGWTAEADGQDIPIYLADGLFRCVIVPAGTNQVDFAFVPRDVRVGLFISLAALLIAVAAGGCYRRVNRDKKALASTSFPA